MNKKTTAVHNFVEKDVNGGNIAGNDINIHNHYYSNSNPKKANSLKTIFISHHANERYWALQVALMLEEKGFTSRLESCNFQNENDFNAEMHNFIFEPIVIVLLSKAYLDMIDAQTKRRNIFFNYLKNNFILTIKVEECDSTEFCEPVINLTSLDDREIVISQLLEIIESEEINPDKPTNNKRNSSYFSNTASQITKVYKNYQLLLKEEFKTLINRKEQPTRYSRTSPLFFGEGFPFGVDEIIPEISKYSLHLDIEKLSDATRNKYKSNYFLEEEDGKLHLLYKLATCRWRIYVAAIADGLIEFDKSILFSPLIEGLKIENIKSEGSLLSLSENYMHYNSSRNYDEGFQITKKLLNLLGNIASSYGITLEDLSNEEKQRYRAKSTYPQNKTNNRRVLFKLNLFFSDIKGSYASILRLLSSHKINIISSKSWVYLSNEVAGAELIIEYKGDIEIYRELDAIFESKPLCNIVIRYEINKTI